MGKTVQGELNSALKKIAKTEQVKTIGSGRTDAGVHALGQVVKIDMPLELQPENLVKALNSHLPDDIKAVDAELCDSSFMPTSDALSKEYHYRFTCNHHGPVALQEEFIAHQRSGLDFKLMDEACKILIGEHDFVNFFCEGTEVKSTVREIFECNIFEVQSGDWMLPAHYVFRIKGNGFLKQMVRLLMGTIWNVGRGKVSLAEFQESLRVKTPSKLGPVAPPQGLYMVRVNY